MDIILASGSPRRRELLTSASLNFQVMSVDIDEGIYPHELPQDYIQRMVASKAEAAIELLNNNDLTHFAQWPDAYIVLSADTIGVLPDGKTVLVKPEERAHAYSMWQRMSDNTHQVWTAVQATLVIRDHESSVVTWQQQIIERTAVSFVLLTPAMMRDYWDSGEPADKAGAYAIQGLAAAWVTHINGSYTNVVGLPLAQTLALIDKASIEYSRQRAIY